MIKKRLLTKLLAILVLLTPLGCNKNDDFQDMETNTPADLTEHLTFNAEQLGAFTYHHIKYYMATVDPYSFIREEYREEFRKDLEAEIKAYEKRNITGAQHLDYLAERGVYSPAQVTILKKQDEDLRNFLIQQNPTADQAWIWLLEQEREIKESDLLTMAEKEELLNMGAIVRYMVKYSLENYDPDIHAPDEKASCNFWSQVFCYLGAVKDMLGLVTAIVAGQPALGVIAAAIGTAVGIYKAVTTCPCDKNVCGPFQGVSLPYTCYTSGSSLTFKGWGHGNVAPASYMFNYFKNNNWNSASNFYSQPGGPTNVLPGTQITQNGVTSVGIRTENICSGIPKIADNGMWTLASLGVPYGKINGQATLTVADASYYPTFTYYISGPVELTNATKTWSIIPSGYPNYSANGTFTGGTTNSTVTIDWHNNQPGYATLRCKATTSCGTQNIDMQIHITP